MLSEEQLEKERIYPISYEINFGKFTEDYLKNNELGGCDNLIIHSIMLPEDGSRTEFIISMDKEGKKLDSLEVFKSFCLMANLLSKDKNLHENKREFCKTIFDIIKGKIEDK